MKWEYKTIKLPRGNFLSAASANFELTALDKFINQLGQQGWELISAEALEVHDVFEGHHTQVVVLFFKRPLMS
jgi:hypothetical protein